jgi:hypothetical protein
VGRNLIAKSAVTVLESEKGSSLIGAERKPVATCDLAPARTAVGPNGPTRIGFHVRFSNRPFEVKRFQTIRHCNVDVSRGLVLLFGIGT